MSDGNFADFIARDRDRLHAEREAIFNQQHELEGKLAAINTEMRATHNLGLSEVVIRRNDPLVQATRQYENDVMGLYNGSFARLREVSLGYTMPGSLVRRFGAARGSITVSARNLWMIWTGQDGFGTRRDGRVGQVDGLGGLWTWDPEIRSAGQISATFQTVLPPTATASVVVRLGW